MTEESVYSFDEFLLDPAARTLRFEGEEVDVEPKVFDFLLLLVREHGRGVSKKEIAQTLWPGGEVSDAMLGRCVYQARRALRSNSKAANFIKTQHGYGFRFSAKVTVHLKPTISRNSTVDFNSSFTRRLTPSSSQRNAGSEFESTDFVQLGFVPLPFDTKGASALFQTGDANHQIETALIGMENVILKKLKIDLNLMSTEEIIQVLQSESLNFLLFGEVSHSADKQAVFLRVNLLCADNGKPDSVPIGSYELSYLHKYQKGPLPQNFYRAVIEQILERTGSALGNNSSVTVGSTSDKNAYRLYLDAHDRLDEQRIREGEVAHALLERALQLDPEFADAWTNLAWARYERMWAAGNGRMWATLALEAVDEALAAAPESVFANYTKVILLSDMGLSESALRLARACLERQPERAEFWHVLGYIYRYMGLIDQSVKATETALNTNPLVFADAGDPPTILIYTREWARFLQLAPAFESPYLCYYRGYALWELGKTNQASSELQLGIEGDPKDIFSRLAQVLKYILEKDFVQANVVLENLVKHRDLLEPSDGEVTFKESKLAMLAGNQELAISRLKKSMASGFNCLPYCESDPVFAPLLSSGLPGSQD